VLEGSVVMQLKGGQQTSTGTQAAPSQRKFLVLLIKDKGAPALVPAQ
jgi:hypothetical protein